MAALAPLAPLGLDHVTIPVAAADPAGVAALAGATSGARVTEGTTVEFSGGWLHFVPGEGKPQLGFSYADAGELGQARQWLTGNGLLAGDPVGATRCELADLDGNRLEVSAAALPSGLPGPRLLHAGLLSADVAAAADFYGASLGLRVSDWISDTACFMRGRNGFHHSLAIVRAPAEPRLDHVCLLYDDLDHLMESRVRVRSAGLAIESDMLKHAPSGSISFYYRLPGLTLMIEHCLGHERVDFESRRPRRLPAAPETRDMWQLGVPAEARIITGGPLAARAD
jgi:catechol 2,3-dioxygenase-like lactoylglutathione lyase family enzyme